jgi:UDP-3-O-acyl-N-acetylglucosamine deacetylase
MRQMGMFKDFTPEDMLVIDDKGSAIDNAFRYHDEPARHKLLDLIGDLALAGVPIHGQITATRSGHALTHAFCRELLTVSGR